MISVVRSLGDIAQPVAAQMSSAAVHSATVIMPTSEANNAARLVTVPAAAALRALSDSPCGDLRAYSKESSPCSSDTNYVSSNGAGCESPTQGGRGGGANAGRPNRDPLSHRIIEKRRRDRMNNCLGHLSRLIPPSFTKKGRGRVEKTEIIEMAIGYMQHVHEEQRRLQQHLASVGAAVPLPQPQPAAQAELIDIDGDDMESGTKDACTCTGDDAQADGAKQCADAAAAPAPAAVADAKECDNASDPKYRQGYFDCVAETLRYFAISGGRLIDDGAKAQLLLHLQKYFGQVTHDSSNSTLATLLYGKAEAGGTGADAVNAATAHAGATAPVGDMMDTQEGDVKPCAPVQIAPCHWTPALVQHQQQSNNNNSGVKISHHPITAAGHIINVVEPEQPLNMCTKQRAAGGQHNDTAATTSLLASASNSLYKLAAAKRLQSSGSSHYPSSPSVGSNEENGSSRQSLSGLSSASNAADSPPRTTSPPSMAAGTHRHTAAQAKVHKVPAFALHTSSMYYVPITLPLGTLADDAVHMLTAQQFNMNAFGMASQHHPVTIPVNFNAASSASNEAARASALHQQHGATATRTCRSYVVNPAVARHEFAHAHNA